MEVIECNFENLKNITHTHISRNALAFLRFPILTTIFPRRSSARYNRDFKITTTATATGTSLNKRFNEQKNGSARAL